MHKKTYYIGGKDNCYIFSKVTIVKKKTSVLLKIDKAK